VSSPSDSLAADGGSDSLPGCSIPAKFRAERNHQLQTTKKKSRNNSYDAVVRRLSRLEDSEAVSNLCQIAHRLGVPIVTAIRWPDNNALRHADGVYISRCGHGSRALLRTLCVSPPVIVLRWNAPDVLGHEIGHHAANVSMCDYLDERMGLPVTPLLDRVAARHGFSEYQRSTRSELRAEAIGRRLLGETLPPTLRGFSARAWQDLQEKTNPTRRDPGRKK
jgi:hypothetical protein